MARVLSALVSTGRLENRQTRDATKNRHLDTTPAGSPMTELLLNILLRLYPREWRNRYGSEVRELIEVLNEEDRRSMVGMMPSLIAGATVERLYAVRRFDMAGVAATAVATVVVLGGSAVMSHSLTPARGRVPSRSRNGRLGPSTARAARSDRPGESAKPPARG